MEKGIQIMVRPDGFWAYLNDTYSKIRFDKYSIITLPPGYNALHIDYEVDNYLKHRAHPDHFEENFTAVNPNKICEECGKSTGGPEYYHCFECIAQFV